jgi:hypothetical protein
MSLPPQLEIDIQSLRDQGYTISAHRDPVNGNRIFVIIEDYPLPNFWNKSRTRLLIIADVSYPYSKLDMFWVDIDVRLKDGRVPQGGGSFENYLNHDWHRFSWHVQKWNPSFDNIITYLGTIDHRLSQPQ